MAKVVTLRLGTTGPKWIRGTLHSTSTALMVKNSGMLGLFGRAIFSATASNRPCSASNQPRRVWGFGSVRMRL